MSPASDLGELLRQLHGVRSPIEQIKLLGRGWRSVRRLTSGERRELAARLGMQELEAVLARLGRKKGGIAPAELLRLLEQADDIDPSNLGRLLVGLRAPEGRKELLKRGLDFVEDRLRDDAAAETNDPEGDGEEAADEEEPDIAPEVDPRGDRGTTSAPPASEPREIAPRATSEAPAPSPTLACAAPPLLEARRVPEPEEPRAAVPDAVGIASRFAAASSLTLRFRLLRGLLADRGELDLSTSRSLTACFPDGWARRRAIAALLRRGLPRPFDDALELIETLERPIDRRWCCATFLDGREPTAEQVRQLGERFPSFQPARRMHSELGFPPM